MIECREKIAGILGGMGPEATVDLLARIIKNTPASDDADHIRCIVDSNPKVPSRIKALLEGTGEDPGPCIADMGRRLELWGADFLAVACNTAHNYYDVLCAAVGIPVLNMVELTVKEAITNLPAIKKSGILAMPAVRLTGLYAKPFAARGVEVIYPSAEAETELFAVIKAVKAGDTGRAVRDSLGRVLRHVAERGAEVGIVACTELSVIIEPSDFPVIDAAEVLAREVVRMARSC